MKTKNIKRNRPIATVLKEYVDKKQGKVQDARVDLHRRFEYLDWSIQKKIIIGHLQSLKQDRMWVYPRLLHYWDDSFIPYVKEVWETYHEERCAWAIVRYFPKEYIMDNLSELSMNRNYYFICLRFAGDDDFVFDKSKLSAMDYLSLCQKQQWQIDPDEALLNLYEIVTDRIFDYRIVSINIERYATSIGPLNFGSIDRAFWYVKQMEMSSVIETFSKWCSDVALVSTKEWSESFDNNQNYNGSNLDYNGSCLAQGIVLKNMGKMLPENITDRLVKVNPKLKMLIEKLKLGVDFDHILYELSQM